MIAAALVLASAGVRSAWGQIDANDLVWQQSIRPFDGARSAELKHLDTVVRGGPFHDDWDSLAHFNIPTWYEDAKFGIFIHWGIYSVPAFNGEWYARHMYEPQEEQYKQQLALHGPVSTFGYKDYIPLFRGERFSADQWVDLFQKAGARYVIPVAEHHDGFQMYQSTLSDWNAVKMGPRRDVLGELRQSILAHGLHFGLSSHRAEHYWFLNTGREIPSDVADPRYASLYGPAHQGVEIVKGMVAHPDPAFLDDWLARSAELVDRYHPELIYFDWWVEQPEFAPYLKRFAAFYYDEAASNGQQPVLFRKNKAFPSHTTVLDIERGQLDHTQQEHWQTDTSVSAKAWGYVEGETYKSPQQLVWTLIDVVSKNGNLLLNVGPKADGTIPAEAVSILLQMGRWLNLNGEAIYGSRPWIVDGEGPHHTAAGTNNESTKPSYTPEDIRFTKKDGSVYAFVLRWPDDNVVRIHALGRAHGMRVRSAHLIGTNASVLVKQMDDVTTFSVVSRPAESFAYVLKVSLATDDVVSAPKARR